MVKLQSDRKEIQQRADSLASELAQRSVCPQGDEMPEDRGQSREALLEEQILVAIEGGQFVVLYERDRVVFLFEA